MKFSLTTDYLLWLLITKLSSVIYMYYAYVHYAHSGVTKMVVVVALSSEKPRNKTPRLLSACMVRHNELKRLIITCYCQMYCNVYLTCDYGQIRTQLASFWTKKFVYFLKSHLYPYVHWNMKGQIVTHKGESTYNISKVLTIINCKLACCCQYYNRLQIIPLVSMHDDYIKF